MSAAQVFPIQSVEDLPEHLRPFANMADAGQGYHFPDPMTPCVVEFDPNLAPGMEKAATLAMQMHDAALLMSYYTVSIWGDCVSFEGQGMAPRDVEQTLAVETARAWSAYQANMRALYDHHGHYLEGKPARRVV